MAHLCCPIEMEPRTLNEGQLSHAREAAVDIVQKLEPNESMNAFIEGLKPVDSTKEMEEMIERRNQPYVLTECKETSQIGDRTYDCACTTNNVDESPDGSKIREPVSAPF